MKVKGLLSELDEIRAQQETAGLQSDHVSEHKCLFILCTKALISQRFEYDPKLWQP